MQIQSLIRQRFASVLKGLADDPSPLLEMIKPAQDARFGDFQANCAMPLGKALGRPPREVAGEIVEQLEIDDLCEPPEVAGPGFINLKLRDEWVADQLVSLIGDDRVGVEVVSTPGTYVVDFSSPNVAKPMHVGHLRSSVIGDAICRTLRFVGHQVISDNHIGDWGTQFGMIIYGYRNFLDVEAYHQDAVTELARLYRLVHQLSDAQAAIAGRSQLEQNLQDAEAAVAAAESDPDENAKKQRKELKRLRAAVEFARDAIRDADAKVNTVEADPVLSAQLRKHPDIAKASRLETARLHDGDAENRALWEEFLPACLNALNRLYARLEVSFDMTLGESFYQPMLADVVTSLKDCGLARESDGAVVVFIEGNEAPFIIRKSDGAFTYATTDLATIQYRAEELKADAALYVVDTRQSEHFRLLFETAAKWRGDALTLKHINFGTVMGNDRKPYKTRSGDTIGLEGVIDEAISRARVIVDENDNQRDVPVLNDEQRSAVAQIVGVGGIKYYDLHHNRESDYVFDWDRMLAKTGDTAAYMQYAYARICGIFSELDVDRQSLAASIDRITLTQPQERALAVQLLQFGDAVYALIADYRPNLLTAWLFQTAERLSSFYAACNVKKAESESAREARLALCDVTARALRTGLSLLGIETADVM